MAYPWRRAGAGSATRPVLRRRSQASRLHASPHGATSRQSSATWRADTVWSVVRVVNTHAHTRNDATNAANVTRVARPATASAPHTQRATSTSGRNDGCAASQRTTAP